MGPLFPVMAVSFEKDCAEGFKYHYYRHGGSVPMNIHPTLSPTPFQVLSWFVQGGRTYIQQRGRTFMNFNRSWDEYRYGFGHIHSSHWLGLHYLTNSEPKQLLYETNNNKRLFTRQVTDLFRIGNNDSNYTVQIVRNEKGELGECMSETVGRSFSTFDRDKDDDVGGNCASIFQSGWWFGSCTDCTMMPGGVWNGSCPSCNPNGPITKPIG